MPQNNNQRPLTIAINSKDQRVRFLISNYFSTIFSKINDKIFNNNDKKDKKLAIDFLGGKVFFDLNISYEKINLSIDHIDYEYNSSEVRHERKILKTYTIDKNSNFKEISKNLLELIIDAITIEQISSYLERAISRYGINKDLNMKKELLEIINHSTILNESQKEEIIKNIRKYSKIEEFEKYKQNIKPDNEKIKEFKKYIAQFKINASQKAELLDYIHKNIKYTLQNIEGPKTDKAEIIKNNSNIKKYIIITSSIFASSLIILFTLDYFKKIPTNNFDNLSKTLIFLSISICLSLISFCASSLILNKINSRSNYIPVENNKIPVENNQIPVENNQIPVENNQSQNGLNLGSIKKIDPSKQENNQNENSDRTIVI
jgi:hypothetical protein